MRLNEMSFGDALPVDGYGPGYFRIGGQVFDGAVIVAEGAAAGWEGYADETPLMALAGRIDVLLVGTGDSLMPLPNRLQPRLEAEGVGVEIMASPSAARSYNVLIAEGRRVAVALVPVSAVGAKGRDHHGR